RHFHSASRRHPLQHLARDESVLTNRRIDRPPRPGPLEEQPGDHVERDDADGNDRGECGWVFVPVGDHLANPMIAIYFPHTAFLAPFSGTSIASATSGFV